MGLAAREMRVLLTGATGNIGRLLRPYLAETYASVLLNGRSPIDDLRPKEVYERGDMCDPELMDRLVGQVDGIIHMGGLVGPDFTFEETLASNFVSVYHLFEAARRHGVRRIIYASTHHAVGFLPRGAHIDHTTPPRPDSWYGITKACGEMLASHAADRYGLDVMTIRIGSVSEKVPDERRVHIWCSARDLASLIQLGLTGPQQGYHLVYGVSNCPDPMIDNRYAESLGYRAQDDSLDHLTDPALAHQVPDPENPEHRYIGGHFAARKDA